jgi:hypothetical protein
MSTFKSYRHDAIEIGRRENDVNADAVFVEAADVVLYIHRRWRTARTPFTAAEARATAQWLLAAADLAECSTAQQQGRAR